MQNKTQDHKRRTSGSDDRLALLFIRQLQQHASEEEQEQLDALLAVSAENRQYAEEIRQIWQASASSLSAPVDVDQEWNIFRTKAGINKTRQFPFLLMKVAAVFILALSAAGIYLYLNRYAQQDIIYTAGQEPLEVNLKDGSTVFLNRNASLTVPQSFHRLNRIVHVAGDAFFVVEKNDHPFVVKANRLQIEVLGTEFYVQDRAQSEQPKVVVRTGTVKVSERHDAQQHVIATRGEEVALEKQVLHKSISFDPNYLSWKTRNIFFDDASLDEVVATLEHVYGVSFQMDPALQQATLTVDFHNQSLDEVLDIISLTLDLQFEKKKDTIQILPM